MFATQPTTPVETTVNIDGMDFERTDIPNGVDDSGLLVAKTLLTQAQARHAAKRLQSLRKSGRPITHGQIVMHAKSGDADVVAWGRSDNPTKTLRYPLRLASQFLAWGTDQDSTLQTSVTGNLFSSALFKVNPGFEHYPADVRWLTSVALAAAKTEADARFMVRLMRDDEYDALLKYVYGDMTEQDIKAMSVLHREEITGPVSVVGSGADTRTRRGITDAFGNALIWMENLYDPAQFPADIERTGTRLQRSAAWFFDPERAKVATRQPPHGVVCGVGVRLVAVPKAPIK